MTRDEADALAKRIINCWRGGPPLDEWRDELEHLDAGTAGTTYARLKRSIDHAPSIARFMAEYNSLHTSDGGTRAPCRYCGDSGWVQRLWKQWAIGASVYTGAEPCSECAAGKTAAASRTWLESKPRDFITDAEADRLVAAMKARHKPDPARFVNPKGNPL